MLARMWSIHSFAGGNIKWHAAAKSLQSCLTLCDPIDGSPPGSPIPGILQARVLEWGAIAFSHSHLEYSLVVSYKTKCIHYPPQLLCFMWLLPPIVFTVVKYTSYKMYYLKLWCARVCVLSCFSCVWLFATLWIVALQNPPSMEFSSQEYWSELPCPPPGDLLDVQSSDTKYIDNVVQPSPSSIFITVSSYNTENLYPLNITPYYSLPPPDSPSNHHSTFYGFWISKKEKPHASGFV